MSNKIWNTCISQFEWIKVRSSYPVKRARTCGGSQKIKASRFHVTLCFWFVNMPKSLKSQFLNFFQFESKEQQRKKKWLGTRFFAVSHLSQNLHFNHKMYCFNPKLTFSKKSKTKTAYLAEGCKFCMKWYILVKLAHLIKSTPSHCTLQ